MVDIITPPQNSLQKRLKRRRKKRKKYIEIRVVFTSIYAITKYTIFVYCSLLPLFFLLLDFWCIVFYIQSYYISFVELRQKKETAKSIIMIFLSRFVQFLLDKFRIVWW